jgi:molecular chaperone DnaK
MERIIGIDLGTTNSCVAVIENGRHTVVLPNAGGYKTTPPSCSASRRTGSASSVIIAKRQAITNARNTVFAEQAPHRPPLGRSGSAQKSIDLCPSTIVRGPNDDPRIKIGDRVYTCPEIAASCCSEMKLVAEEYTGEKVEKAVITVPAYFNDAQRQAPRTPARSPASTSCASSTSRRRRRSPTA